MATRNQQAGTSRKPSSFVPNASGLVHDVVASVDGLRDVYAEENAALNAADARLFMDIQERKVAAARRYQTSVSELLARKDELKGRFDPRLKQILQMKQEEFAKLSRENLENLDRMRRCTERLGKRIAQAARESVKKDAHAYGAQGHLAYTERRVSMGVNESA